MIAIFPHVLPWMIATLAKNTKFPKKTTLAGAWDLFVVVVVVVVDALVVASSRSGAHGLGPFVAAAMHKIPFWFRPICKVWTSWYSARQSLARSRIVQMHALKDVLRTGQQREEKPKWENRWQRERSGSLLQ